MREELLSIGEGFLALFAVESYEGLLLVMELGGFRSVKGFSLSSEYVLGLPQ